MMNPTPTKSCLIINNQKFQSERKGSEKDRDQFEKIFKSFGFVVDVENDLDSKEMKEILEKFAFNQNINNCDATVIIILSHGLENFICGIKHGGTPAVKDYITYQELVAFFNNEKCPNLKNKPKMFIFQACLGDKTSKAVTDCPSNACDSDDSTRFPDTSNVLLAFPAQKGYSAWRNTTYGSYYPLSLIYVLTKKAHDMDLLEMLMLVERNMRQIDLQDIKGVCLSTFVALLGWSTKLYFTSTDQKTSVDLPHKNFKLTLDDYILGSKSKGSCLIINNIKNSDSFEEMKLKEVFRNLNFLVDVQSDLTADKMKKVVKTMAKTDHKHAGGAAVIIIILSYGNSDCIFGKNYETSLDAVTYNDILNCVNNEKCPHLRSKPKLFFFQVCHKNLPPASNDNPNENKTWLFDSDTLERFPETSDVLLSLTLSKDCTTESGEHVSTAYVSSLLKVFTQVEKKKEIRDILLELEGEFQSVRLQSTECSTLTTYLELIGWSKNFYLSTDVQLEDEDQSSGFQSSTSAAVSLTTSDQFAKLSNNFYSSSDAQNLTRDLIKEGVLLVLGGVSEGRLRSEVEAFIPSKNKWFKIRNIRDAPNNESVAVTNGSTVFVLEYRNQRFRSLDTWEMKWNRLEDPPMYRDILSASLINDKIFWMWGKEEDGNQCDVYSITRNSWSRTAKMNAHRMLPSSAALQEKLFCTGGRQDDEKGPYLDSVESYDPKKNVWTFVASMSVARQFHSLVSFGGYLWAVGGINIAGVVQGLEIYDQENDFWNTLKSMTTARYHLTAIFLDNHLYAVGGVGAEGELITVEMYSPETNDWTIVPSLKRKRHRHASLAFQEVSPFPKMPSHSVIPFEDLTADMIKKGVLLVMGGHAAGCLGRNMEAFITSEREWVKIRNIEDEPNNIVVSVTNGRIIYAMDTVNKRFRSLDPLEMKWKILTGPPEYRDGMTASILDENIYLMGGKKVNGNKCDVYNIATNLWSETPEMNIRRVFAGSATIAGKVFYAGGMDEKESTLDSVDFYDPMEQKWSEVVSMDMPRSHHSLVSFDENLWAVGGKNPSGFVTELDVFNLQNNFWRTLSFMPTGRINLSATFFENHLYVIGGWTELFEVGDEINGVEVYDPKEDKWIPAEPLKWKRQGHTAFVIQHSSDTDD